MVTHLKKNWEVLQDVHGMGETYEIFQYDFDQNLFGLPKMKAMSPWQPIDRLEHLQLALADNPYYGFGLRQFNEAPWWYKNVFDLSEKPEYAQLVFKGVDYYAEVWLNEVYLGSHEGYNTSFSFEVGSLLKEKNNLLVVKVSAPFDTEIMPEGEYDRFLHVIHQQFKGTYEHTDSFLPRDVNPIGIWNDVDIISYDGVREEGTPLIQTVLNQDYSSAEVTGAWSVFSQKELDGTYVIKARLVGEPEEAASCTGKIHLTKGVNTLQDILIINDPKLWTVWERGTPYMYTVSLSIQAEGREILHTDRDFGIRQIEVFRDETDMYFTLNGEKIFLRGATYFPDVYVSANHEALYRRDIANAKSNGLNTFRIHVHTEKDEFYQMCDRAGMLLIQDSDFNWTHPLDEAWTERASRIFSDVIIRLRNHPSIFCWVLLNEAREASYLTDRPGPQFKEIVQRLMPGTPYILNSWDIHDKDSGDSHNYEGSLHGKQTHYTNIYDWPEKLNTEFGMDAPPVFATLRREPELVKILGKVTEGIDSIQYYQYRLIKYFIEHYRIHKFRHCGGYYLFLFSDVAPSSHFGVYDRCGIPKLGQQALFESSQPIAVMLEAERKKPTAVWIVNDLLKPLGKVKVTCTVTDSKGCLIFRKALDTELGANDSLQAFPVDFPVVSGVDYTVHLQLLDETGNLLADNIYEKAFTHPEHVSGHPYLMHQGIALRTYWAWLDRYEDQKEV